MKIGPYGGNRNRIVTAPKNYGQSSMAQQVLDATVARANAQYVEAINLDGIEINYWHRCTEGRFCTCHDPNAAQDLRALPSGIDSVDQNNAADNNASSSADDVVFQIRGAWGNAETRKNVMRSALGTTIGELPASESLYEENKDYTEETDEQMEAAADEEALVRMSPDSAILFGAERTRCGICFRTGYVNGYGLIGGRRDVLDLSGGFPAGSRGFVVNRRVRPNAFEAANDTASFVEWEYEVPTYFERCMMVAVRNNVNEALGVVAEVRVAGTVGAFQPLTTALIESMRGQSVVLQMRVRPKHSKIDGTVQFTHVELVYQFAPWPKVQMPNTSEATNFAVFDSLLTSEMTLPPTIAHASKEDVVWESKYGRLWKVTDITDFMTAAGQVCGWNANVRVVQDYEQLALLRLMRDKQFALSYGKLEAIQGARIASASEF